MALQQESEAMLVINSSIRWKLYQYLINRQYFDKTLPRTDLFLSPNSENFVFVVWDNFKLVFGFKLVERKKAKTLKTLFHVF